jgi:hypothetical protein
MKKNQTQPSMDCFDAECFNCFKRGFCEKTITFTNARRKPLHFCAKPCMDAFIQDEIAPGNLIHNQQALDKINQMLGEIKKDSDVFILKKSFTIEKLLRTSLALRKPKAELERLYTLWKECATETLQKIGDDKEMEESVFLLWADGMKKHENVFPSLIESLGR